MKLNKKQYCYVLFWISISVIAVSIVQFTQNVVVLAKESSQMDTVEDPNQEQEEEVTSKTSTVNIVHVHSGSAGGGGGCYGQKHTTTKDVQCNKPVTKVSWNQIVCSAGHTQSNNVAGGYDTWPVPSHCGIVVGSTTETHYSINCGQSNRVLATVSMTQTPTEWTREPVHLSATFQASGLVPQENPLVITGPDTNSTSNEVEVSRNGIYTCRLLTSTPNTSAATSVVQMAVTNIDMIPPTIEALTYDDTPFLESTVLSVHARDLQEDGTLGIGLATEPYSFDEGVTWVAEPELEILKNGTYTVMVKDAFDHITTETIDITTLDTMGPTIYSIHQDKLDTKTHSVKVSVSMNDIQEDGSPGIGIAEQAYSFTGGSTWQAENYYYYHRNGTYYIWVKDLLEHITKSQVTISQFPIPQEPSIEEPEVVPVLPPIEEEEEDPVVEEVPVVVEEEEERVLGIIEPDRTEIAIMRYEIEETAEEAIEVVEELHLEEDLAKKEAEERMRRIAMVKQVVLLSTASVAGVTGITALIYCFLFTSLVFGITTQGRRKFLGLARVRSRKRLEICVYNHVVERNESPIYMIYVNPFVVRRYLLESTIVRLGEVEILTQMDTMIQVELPM